MKGCPIVFMVEEEAKELLLLTKINDTGCFMIDADVI